MKVLLLTTHLDFGGISIYCISLAKELRIMGHDVRIASKGGALIAELDKCGIIHIQLDIRTKSELSPLLWKSRFKLERIFKQWSPDIIHAQTRVTQVLAWMIYKKTGIPYVSTCHGFFRPHLGRRIFGFWGERVIAISDAVREHLVNDLKVKKEKVVLINNGIDIKKFDMPVSEKEKNAYRSRIGIKPGFVVGVVARLSPVKGHKYLLLAVKDLLSQYPDLQLLIIGDGPSKKEIIDLAMKLGLGNCTFMEESTIDTGLSLSVMDAFVLPSVQEGLGLSLLEAMAAGVPVVGSNVGGVYSLIKDGVTGLLFMPKDHVALAGALNRILSDKKNAGEMAFRAKDFVREKFSLDLMTRSIEAIYKETVGA